MKSYRQLALEQRYQIACLLQQKVTQKSIAAIVGVNASTISREIKRNSLSTSDYKADMAQVICGKRTKRNRYKLKGELKE